MKYRKQNVSLIQTKAQSKKLHRSPPSVEITFRPINIHKAIMQIVNFLYIPNL